MPFFGIHSFFQPKLFIDTMFVRTSMGSLLRNSYLSAQSFFFLDSMFGQKMASFFVDFIFLTPIFFHATFSPKKKVISFCWRWHPHFCATCVISKGSLFLDFVLFFCQRVTFLWLHTFGCNCQTTFVSKL